MTRVSAAFLCFSPANCRLGPPFPLPLSGQARANVALVAFVALVALFVAHVSSRNPGAEIWLTLIRHARRAKSCLFTSGPASRHTPTRVTQVTRPRSAAPPPASLSIDLEQASSRVGEAGGQALLRLVMRAAPASPRAFESGHRARNSSAQGRSPRSPHGPVGGQLRS